MDDLNVFGQVKRIPDEILGAPFLAKKDSSGLWEFICDLSDLEHVKYVSGIIQHLISRDRHNQVECFSRLSEHEVWPLLQAFMQARPNGSYRPDFVDLWYLYWYIREARPKEVVELGSGFSTVVMAAALKHNGTGRLHSLEPSREWANVTAEALPDPIRHISTILYSEGRECAVGDRNSVCFADRPVTSPDMIYIDAAPEGARWMGAETVAQWEDALLPGTTIFVDGRIRAATLFLARGWLKRRYKAQVRAICLVDQKTKKALGQPLGLDLFANSCFRLIG